LYRLPEHFRLAVPLGHQRPQRGLSAALGFAQDLRQAGRERRRKSSSVLPGLRLADLFDLEPGRLEVFNVRLGTVRQRAQLQPKLQLWHRSAQAWTGTLGQVEVMEKQ
jgi:hypothetical protein